MADSKSRTATPAARVGPPVRLLKRPEVEARVALTRTTIYNYIREGKFPRPVTLGVRNVAWLESEIEAWIASRIEARK